MILLSFTKGICLDPRYTMLEYFSGAGKVSQVFRETGRHQVGTFELRDSRSMDMMSPAGLAHLVKLLKGCKTPLPRLAVMMALQSYPGALHLYAPVCSSWTMISRGTSWRTPINVFGDLTKPWVQGANAMLSRHLAMDGFVRVCFGRRVVALLLISLATHATFLVEQPQGSTDVFPNHPRFSWLCNRVCYVSCLPQSFVSLPRVAGVAPILLDDAPWI